MKKSLIAILAAIMAAASTVTAYAASAEMEGLPVDIQDWDTPAVFAAGKDWPITVWYFYGENGEVLGSIPADAVKDLSQGEPADGTQWEFWLAEAFNDYRKLYGTEEEKTQQSQDTPPAAEPEQVDADALAQEAFDLINEEARVENGLHEMRGRNAEELQKRLEDLVGVTKWTNKRGQEENVEIDSIGDKSVLVEAEKADEDKMEIDDAKAVQLYVTSGVIGSDALNYLVATKIDDIIEEYEHVVQYGGNNGIYDHNYTVSVSTSSKSVNGAEATFVAVQVVRSSVRS